MNLLYASESYLSRVFQAIIINYLDFLTFCDQQNNLETGKQSSE